ncbi:hypothetical protein GCM10010261_60010 [Streptomyces pilosus]|nr:hypothetical protein GCM10010261_60010 [Streptomyces pilosus]
MDGGGPTTAAPWRPSPGSRTCSPWRGPPDELGSYQPSCKRLIRWAVDGTWAKIFAAVPAKADAVDDIGWTVSVDSTVVRAHQHAAGALLIMGSDAPAAG